MAYENNISTSPVNLLTRLVTFLTANGWTLDSSVADGSGSVGWRAHLHRSGVYVNLRAATNETIWAQQGSGAGYGLGMYLGTGYSGALAWNKQAGAPLNTNTPTPDVVGVAMNLPIGSVSGYHFLTDSSGDNVVIVVEKTPGIFTHMGFGVSILTAGAITGGPYFYSVANGYSTGQKTSVSPGVTQTAREPLFFNPSLGDSPAYVRADVDTFTGKWLSTGQNPSAGPGYTGKKAWGPMDGSSAPIQIPKYGDPTVTSSFVWRQVSAMNQMANLLPLRWYAERDTSGYSLLGSIPNVFATNAVGKGFSQLSELALGSDTYLLFPNFAVKKVV